MEVVNIYAWVFCFRLAEFIVVIIMMWHVYSIEFNLLVFVYIIIKYNTIKQFNHLL